MTVIDVLVAAAVLVAIVVSQLRTHPVSVRRARVAGVLGLVGVVQVHAAVGDHPVPAAAWALLVAALAVGAGLGVWRAFTMRMWSADGVVLTRGTWATAALWALGALVDVGLHLLTAQLVPAAAALGSAGTLLVVAASLGAQALMVLRRAQGQPAEAPAVRA